MPKPEFPADLERFIASHIESVAQLEILLLLRAEPSSQFTPMRVAESLELHPALAWGWLASLHAKGLLARAAGETSDTFRYHPSRTADERLVDALAVAHAARPGTLASFIDRHSVDELHAFSDAFHFRKRDR